MAELKEDPSKTDIVKWMADNWASGGINTVLSPYDIIKKFMEHGYKPGAAVGQPDIHGITNAADISTMLMGTGATLGAANIANEAGSILGAFKPSLKGFKPTYWTPENVDTLKAVIKKYEGQPGRLKNTMNEFRRRQEELGRPYTQSDSALQTQIARIKSWGSPNVETGAASTNVGPEPFGTGTRGPEFDKRSKDFKLGSNFGNFSTGDKNQALIDWLKSQQPVGTAEIKSLAEDMGLKTKVREAKPNKSGISTTYLYLKDPANPGNRATVRFPNDVVRHYGDPGISTDPKSTLFDTGYGFPPDMIKEINPKANPRPLDPANVITAGGESYAKPGVLPEVLRAHFFGQAPGGDLRLVSPEYARFPKEPMPEPKPYGPQLPENWSPNQLKLLSGRPTPSTADIIKILQQQQQGVLSGNET